MAAASPQRPRPGALIGEITHYFPKIMVCVLKLNAPISVGDNLLIQGPKTSFTQKVLSLQIESVNVKSAGKGRMVGLKVDNKCREGDRAYRVKI